MFMNVDWFNKDLSNARANEPPVYSLSRLVNGLGLDQKLNPQYFFRRLSLKSVPEPAPDLNLGDRNTYGFKHKMQAVQYPCSSVHELIWIPRRNVL